MSSGRSPSVLKRPSNESFVSAMREESNEEDSVTWNINSSVIPELVKLKRVLIRDLRSKTMLETPEALKKSEELLMTDINCVGNFL